MIQFDQIGLDVVRGLIDTLLSQQVSGQSGSCVEADDISLSFFLLIVDVVEKCLVLNDRSAYCTAKLLPDGCPLVSIPIAWSKLSMAEKVEGAAMELVGA